MGTIEYKVVDMTDNDFDMRILTEEDHKDEETKEEDIKPINMEVCLKWRKLVNLGLYKEGNKEEWLRKWRLKVNCRWGYLCRKMMKIED